MKVLIFLSRVAFICNLFFIAAMILWYVETSKKSAGNNDVLMDPGFITNTIVILGYSAVFLNASIAVAYLIVAVSKRGRKTRLPSWLVIANLIFFCIQIYFFFFL